MKKAIILVFSFFTIISYGQDLKCENFKDGTFTLEATEPFKMKFKIIRKGNEQKEILVEVPEELKDSGLLNFTVYGIVEWIDDCSYRLTYDESKMELDDTQKMINSVGGVLTQYIKVEENCVHYKSLIKYNESELVIDGVICK